MNKKTKILISFFSYSCINTLLYIHTDSKIVYSCDLYATVLYSKDVHYPFGKSICQGDKVSPVSTIYVACLKTLTAGNVLQPKDMARCEPEKPQEDPCPNNQDKSCRRIRQPISGPKPSIKEPIGTLISSSQKTFKIRWESVPEARYYDLYIWDTLSVKHWKLTSSCTEFETSKFEQQKLYQIVVIAYGENNKRLSSSTSAVKLLSKANTIDLEKYINSAKKLKDRAVKIYSISAIYDSFGLIDDSINFLKDAYNEDKNNPLILRLIGDNYIIAGKLDLAENVLNKANMVSKYLKNAEEEKAIKLSLLKIKILKYTANNTLTPIPN